MVTRKEKVRRLKVVRHLVESGSFQLPAGNEDLYDKAVGVARWVKNFPPTKQQLEVMVAAYLAMPPELRSEGDRNREMLIKAARNKL
jgi:hypothetical protein